MCDAAAAASGGDGIAAAGAKRQAAAARGAGDGSNTTIAKRQIATAAGIAARGAGASADGTSAVTAAGAPTSCVRGAD